MPDHQPDNMTLDTLARGALAERFTDELTEVVDNILDPNTKETATRTMTMKLTFKPADRKTVMMTITVDKKLASAEPISTVCFVGKDRQGRTIAAENNPDQGSLFDHQPGVDEDATLMGSKVSPIRNTKEA